jgi:hypothetical protein
MDVMPRWAWALVALVILGAVVVGAVLLGAFDDDEDGERGPVAQETQPALTPPPTPVGSPTPTSTPSPEPTCTNEEQVIAATAFRAPGVLTGDVDGDGTQDRVFVAVDQGGPVGCQAFVGVETPGGVLSAPIAEEEIPFDVGLPTLNVLAPIDGLTGIDVVVDINAGASTGFAGVFSAGEGDLARVTVEGDEPATNDLFAYGGSVGHIDASDCTEDGFVVRSTATVRQGGDVYDVVRRFYIPAGTTLQPNTALTERTTRTLEQLTAFPEFAVAPFTNCL